jgi:NAD(P)H-hydrate epimerase
MTLTNLLTEQAAASLAHKIVSSEQVRLLEPQAALDAGCGMFELMQRAGEAAFAQLIKNWPDAQNILVIAGNGNNAGDGYVVATLAKQHGLNVQLGCHDPHRVLEGDAKQAQSLWHQAAGESVALSSFDYAKCDLIVDALLGTGFTGQVKSNFLEVINKVNQAQRPILSIDIPSGMQADTGQALPVCIKADLTITFVAIKPGLVTGIGKTYSGQLIYADLGIGKTFFDLALQVAQLVDWPMLQALQARPIHANKGSFGKLLCIGGNQGMAGAIRLSVESALRTGVGLVKVFCHESSSALITSGRPEIMLTHKNLKEALDWCSCIVIGPGLGQDEWAKQQFCELMAYLELQPKPLVLDADALNILADIPEDSVVIKTLAELPEVIITPHPGEASRLLGCDIASIEGDRYQASLDITQKYHCTTVLKGAGSIIQAKNPDQCWICEGGNPGMATAGMGDLLTGITGAFLALGMTAQQAAIYAVCAHAEAGDRVATQYGQRGMIASDLFQPLRAIVNGL